MKSLAAMYTGMSASRAASILDRMSLEQLVLILYEMRTEDRGNILGRMWNRSRRRKPPSS